MRTLDQILESYRNGEFLPLDELKVLNLAMQQMAELAFRLGPLFGLAGNYASQIQQSTSFMIEARKKGPVA